MRLPCVRLLLAGAPLDERSTVEEARLFGRAKELTIDLKLETIQPASRVQYAIDLLKSAGISDELDSSGATAAESTLILEEKATSARRSASESTKAAVMQIQNSSSGGVVTTGNTPKPSPSRGWPDWSKRLTALLEMCVQLRAVKTNAAHAAAVALSRWPAAGAAGASTPSFPPALALMEALSGCRSGRDNGAVVDCLGHSRRALSSAMASTRKSAAPSRSMDDSPKRYGCTGQTCARK